MTKPTLQERLSHLVASADENWAAVAYPVVKAPTAVAVVGSVRPLRHLGGAAAEAAADHVLKEMPPGWADVWIHQRAVEREETEVLAEADRRDVDVSTFDNDRLDHKASWDRAQLDPPKLDEGPEYPEAEARAVATSALKHEGLSVPLLGEHLLFCRYTFGSTRSQPVWLALFRAQGAEHLIVINADSDMLLQPVIS